MQLASLRISDRPFWLTEKHLKKSLKKKGGKNIFFQIYSLISIFSQNYFVFSVYFNILLRGIIDVKKWTKKKMKIFCYSKFSGDSESHSIDFSSTRHHPLHPAWASSMRSAAWEKRQWTKNRTRRPNHTSGDLQHSAAPSNFLTLPYHTLANLRQFVSVNFQTSIRTFYFFSILFFLSIFSVYNFFLDINILKILVFYHF